MLLPKQILCTISIRFSSLSHWLVCKPGWSRCHGNVAWICACDMQFDSDLRRFYFYERLWYRTHSRTVLHANSRLWLKSDKKILKPFIVSSFLLAFHSCDHGFVHVRSIFRKSLSHASFQSFICHEWRFCSRMVVPVATRSVQVRGREVTNDLSSYIGNMCMSHESDSFFPRCPLKLIPSPL